MDASNKPPSPDGLFLPTNDSAFLLGARANVRCDTLEKEVAHLDTRMTTAEKRLDIVERRVDRVEDRVGHLEERVTQVESDVDEVGRRLSAAETRLTAAEAAALAALRDSRRALESANRAECSAAISRLLSVAGALEANSSVHITRSIEHRIAQLRLQGR